MLWSLQREQEEARLKWFFFKRQQQLQVLDSFTDPYYKSSCLLVDIPSTSLRIPFANSTLISNWGHGSQCNEGMIFHDHDDAKVTPSGHPDDFH